jgi:hypothetical protein
MACNVGQIIARGDRRWLIRVDLGRDHDGSFVRNNAQLPVHIPRPALAARFVSLDLAAAMFVFDQCLLDPEACGTGYVFAIEHFPGLWPVRSSPVPSLNEVGFCPDLTIDGVGCEDRDLNGAFGGNSTNGIHDVRVTVSANLE